MRKFSYHTPLTLALTLISVGLLTNTSSAERFYQGREYLSKNCTATGGMFTVENSGAYSCVRTDYGMSTNCSASGSCATVDNRRPDGTPSGGPRGDGKGNDDGKGRSLPPTRTTAGTDNTPRLWFRTHEAPAPIRSSRAFRSKTGR